MMRTIGKIGPAGWGLPESAEEPGLSAPSAARRTGVRDGSARGRGADGPGALTSEFIRPRAM